MTILLIKNVSSSISHKKTVKLQNFSFFLSSLLINKQIVILIFMNANIEKMQIPCFFVYEKKLNRNQDLEHCLFLKSNLVL